MGHGPQYAVFYIERDGQADGEGAMAGLRLFKTPSRITLKALMAVYLTSPALEFCSTSPERLLENPSHCVV